jgi:hypothetical protein
VSAGGCLAAPILIQMPGELGRDWSLPLMPAGAMMFESLPFGALVLDALASAVGSGLISLHDGGREGVIVARDSVMSESVWVAEGTRSTGDEAIELIRLAAGATVSACRLSDEAMNLVGPLIRSELCYGDLRLEWVVWPRLLDDLRERGRAFVVELTTPTGRGVTIIQQGRPTATFAESYPALGGPDLVDDLAAGGIGAIRILVDPGARAASPPGPLSVAAATLGGTSVGDQLREPVSHLVARPIAVQNDDPNTILSALFGPHPDAAHEHLVIDSDPPSQGAPTPVDSLLPELKLLVRNRLQMSSASVEEVVDGAASDRQSVEWLADRVRVMTVRGYLHSTFVQLADDMLALTRRDTG